MVSNTKKGHQRMSLPANCTTFKIFKSIKKRKAFKIFYMYKDVLICYGGIGPTMPPSDGKHISQPILGLIIANLIDLTSSLGLGEVYKFL